MGADCESGEVARGEDDREEEAEGGALSIRGRLDLEGLSGWGGERHWVTEGEGRGEFSTEMERRVV